MDCLQLLHNHMDDDVQVMSYLQLARATPGAELHTGQAELQLPPHNRAGCFVQPTVITGIPDQHR